MNADRMHDPGPGDGPSSAAELAEIVGWIGEAADVERLDVAADVAQFLVAATPEESAAYWTARWPVEGLVQVLDQMPPDARAAACAALPATTGIDTDWLHRLVVAAVQHAAVGAVDAADLLTPGNVASLLLLAVQASGSGAAYCGAVAASVQAVSAPQALPTLVAALGSTVVPSRVTRPAAALFEVASARFGDNWAVLLLRAHLCLRLIGPFLPPPAATGLTDVLTAEVVPNDLREVDAALTLYADHIAAAGQAAEAATAAGEDPDDMIVQRGAALQNMISLIATFSEPTPPDPLGTLPAVPVTALGQAILKARRKRNTDYDWGAILSFQAEQPDDFADLLIDERAIVLDLVLEDAGVAPTALP